ncbi:sodium:solute symporter family protein (plasmid) [Burkholderia vietnamiensis]|uniref:Na+/solute symporter n=1 Tax=Burkholderia vietnamiensis (strain G4 / LMG 22486) TaxID=269482 RepID=A4JTS3_BURVG|nr:Na+/solute symporter [Burkholderia vietnamiensis G4]MCB4350166.1 sodium:solute symporter family protein [Burkholderia vietnamiensis]
MKEFALAYGIIVLFFGIVVYVLERSRRVEVTFSDYAVAGRSFGAWFQTMSFLNTWLPGAVFIAFAGLAAKSGIIGFYMISYSLLAMLFMFFMAERVHDWGQKFDLRTQADFVGMRYNSRAVRVTAAVIGIISVFPWLVLGMQSVGAVFSSLSFGYVGPVTAVFVGVAVLALRQVWTVRMGMRGIVISDMVQGVAAYGLGFFIAVGMIVWLCSHGHGFTGLPREFAVLPGHDGAPGPLYFMSIVLTGALGAWCWPDIFVRLFTADGTETIKKSALQAAPLLFCFAAALFVMSMLAHSIPAVQESPDNVWFITASFGGPVLLALAGVSVLAATMGNINAITAAVGTQVAQDVLPSRALSDVSRTRVAKVTIVVVTLLAVAASVVTAHTTSGLVAWAMTSYQGIVQLAPSLYLGIFWRRGNAFGAVFGMIAGFAVAAALQLVYPVSIPWLGGLTSGVAGILVNSALYILFALLAPTNSSEQHRIDLLFRRLDRPERPLGSDRPEPAI